MRAHLVPERRFERGRQRGRAVEAPPCSAACTRRAPTAGGDAIDARVDLELADARQPRHQRRVMGEVLAQPGMQILGGPLVGHEVGAPRARGRGARRVGDRRTARTAITWCSTSAAARVGRTRAPSSACSGSARPAAVSRSSEPVEIELQRELRRRAVVEQWIVRARRRVHQRPDEPGDARSSASRRACSASESRAAGFSRS